MGISVPPRKSLCRACHTLKPSTQMIHTYGGRQYCSKGCVAKAAWLIDNIPMQRKNS